MTGIALMLFGVFLLTAGIFIYMRSQENGSKVIAANENTKISFVETRLQDKRTTLGDSTVEEDIQEVAISTEKASLPTKVSIQEEATASIITPVVALAKNSESKVASEAKRKTQGNLDDESKRKGDDFEKFIIQKFNRKYFSIKEWEGDKYVNGLYAETTLNPDMTLELNLKDEKKQFAVECKWKQNFYRNGVEVASNAQLARYKKFETEKGIPVFMTVGIDGEAASPKSLYVIPLKEIKDNFIHVSQLKKFEKDVNEKFFFDLKSEVLQ
ncbi:hypothetical protein [Rufibacter tibetensis]|nr:hypothetical protein [Rufibacter tibetensis]